MSYVLTDIWVPMSNPAPYFVVERQFAGQLNTRHQTEDELVEKLLFQSPPVLHLCLVTSQLECGLLTDVLCLLHYEPVRGGNKKKRVTHGDTNYSDRPHLILLGIKYWRGELHLQVKGRVRAQPASR